MFKDVSLIFLLLSLFAEVVGTVGGFGSSVFFVPLANMYFDFHMVLGITALFHLASNLSKIALFRKGLDKKLMINMGVPAIIFVIIGGFLSKFAPTRIAEICLGITLISISSIFLIKPKLEIKPGKKEAVTGGILSGFLAGFLGTGGAIRGLTMAAFNLEKSVFVATSAMIDLGVDATRTVVYSLNGYITSSMLPLAGLLVLVGFIGTFIGRYLLDRIPQNRFRLLSLFMILIIGIITIFGIKLA